MSLDRRIDRLVELLGNPRVADPPSERDLARSLMRLVATDPDHPSIAEAETLLQLQPGALKDLNDRIVAKAVADAERPAFMEPLPPPPLPGVPRAPEPEPEGFVSPIQQMADLNRREMAGWNQRPAPRVLRQRPRSR